MADMFFTIRLLLVAGCCCLAGCAADSQRPATFPVRGKVTYDGKPVADATVAFLAHGAPRPAVGTTDEAGNYRLTTFEPDDGAVMGIHIVTVKKYGAEPVGAPPTAEVSPGAPVDAAAIERAMQETAAEMAKAEKTGSELPSKYGARATSDLRKDVHEGENVINIELTD